MSSVPVPSARRARVRVGAGAALILVLLGLGTAVLVTALTPQGATTIVAPGQPDESGVAPADGADVGVAPSAVPGAADGSAPIFVHILGAVERPGLYEVRDGARAVDVVAAAGGFSDAADAAGVNLARFVSDGEQIVVPVVGQAAPPGAGGGGPTGVGADGVVDINTADAAALETLPRVGPAMAQRIIDWREANGRFSSVDDLLDVAGIGEKTLAGMRDLVTV